MTISEYQRKAMRTDTDKTQLERLINAALGLAGEGGEVADIVKKAVFQGHSLDIEHLSEELGDVAWYLAQAATAIGVPLDAIMCANIEKLEKRYPEGFSVERSVNREVEANG